MTVMDGVQTEWIEVELGDHVDLLTGFPFKSSKFVTKGEFIRLLKGSVLAPGALNWNGCVGWPINESSDFRKYELQLGDVVLAMDRPWVASGLKFAWITDADLPSLLVQRVARLRGARGLDTEFLRYVIGGRDFSNYIEPITTGVSVPHISPGLISSFRFMLPPLPTQKKVAAILSAYDDLIENNNRRIKLLEEMAQRIYREWFVDFRYPGHESVPLVDSELGLIPDGWKVTSLSEIVSSVRDSVRSGPDTLNVPYVPIDCISAMSLCLGDWKSGEHANSSLIRFEADDVLFGAMRPYFHKVAIAPFAGTTRGTCFVLRAMNMAFWSFVVMTLFDERTVDFASRHSSGSTIPYARWASGLETMPVLMPTGELAAAFEVTQNPILKFLQGMGTMQANLRLTRDLLLPRLISGEIDVTDLDISLAETAA